MEEDNNSNRVAVVYLSMQVSIGDQTTTTTTNTDGGELHLFSHLCFVEIVHIALVSLSSLPSLYVLKTFDIINSIVRCA